MTNATRPAAPQKREKKMIKIVNPATDEAVDVFTLAKDKIEDQPAGQNQDVNAANSQASVSYNFSVHRCHCKVIE